ncbi:hypothetical protein E2C01_078954 [Portunus trituberculatus]|uniref:Uncharacterized protein n=1 Tax=Portunus trituberculatus TaxID=210409 RepID=A0A5B7IP26_PORTR|nr:hypothetical protein [Portunus trituberculatus]
MGRGAASCLSCGGQPDTFTHLDLQWQGHPTQPGATEGVPRWQSAGGGCQGEGCWELHLHHH